MEKECFATLRGSSNEINIFLQFLCFAPSSGITMSEKFYGDQGYVIFPAAIPMAKML